MAIAAIPGIVNPTFLLARVCANTTPPERAPDSVPLTTNWLANEPSWQPARPQPDRRERHHEHYGDPG